MKKAIILLYIILITAKFLLAAHLNLFGDEAFYWQCAQHPSFSYIDHPPLTALLVLAGTQLLGNTSLGVRFLFLLCGALFPIALFFLARPVTGDKNAWLAAGFSLVFPGTAYLGLVAIPDVPMLLISVLAAACFERAIREGATKSWVMAGIFGAMGFLTHYRFVLIPAAAFCYLILTSRGRSHLRGKGPWLTGLLLLSGLIPILLFNLQMNFEPVHYYLAGRHAVSFDVENLGLFILKQILMTTPFFFIALMGTLVVLLKKAKNKDDPAILFLIFAAVPLIVFFSASPFEDSGLATVHWPVPGYVFLLPFLPVVLINFVAVRPTILRKTFAALVPGLSGLAMIVAALVLGFGWLHMEILERPFSSWSNVAEKLEKDILPGISNKNSHVLITAADTYVLGANLEFLMHDKLDMYILDHPRNIQHGRAHQYRIWNRDEEALRKNVGRDVLVLVEETALQSIERWEFQQGLCALFESIDYLGDMQLKNSGRRFQFLLGNNLLDVSDTSSPDSKKRCELGIFSYVDTPGEGSTVSGIVKIQGWAFKDDRGVSSIEILVNGHVAGTARYGIPRPDVRMTFHGSRDPRQPNVGFEFYWDSGKVKPGAVEMAIRVSTADGRKQVLNQRTVTVIPTKSNDLK